MNNSTPFSRWSEQGLPDPHGDYYGIGYDCSNISDYELIERLGSGFPNIMILTLAKERLRYLSRKVYDLYSDHKDINTQRFNLPLGEQTDDELANSFYLYETFELCHAGSERMRWLCELIVSKTKLMIEERALLSLAVHKTFMSSYVEVECSLLTQDNPVHYKTSSRSKFKKRSRNNKRG